MTRLQDICKGFEPLRNTITKEVTYKPFLENPKTDALLELLEEIDIEHNQVVVWCSRRLMLQSCAKAFEKEGYTFVIYDGSAKDSEKEDAERKFANGEAQIFLANQASGAYGLNCLAQCSYAVYMCIDGSVEKYHQSQHRILRGELQAPKFAYGIYAEGTIEVKQWEALRVGQEILSGENSKDIFTFA